MGRLPLPFNSSRECAMCQTLNVEQVHARIYQECTRRLDKPSGGCGSWGHISVLSPKLIYLYGYALRTFHKTYANRSRESRFHP